MRRDEKERIYGPYKHGNRWRIVIRRPDGEASTLSFASEAEAQAVVDAAREEVEGRTVKLAIDAYLERMRGRDVLWQPGTDHAGIATQMVVERQMMERQEPDRRKIGREQIVTVRGVCSITVPFTALIRVGSCNRAPRPPSR